MKNMKFIHIADVHLGATPDANYPWGKVRSREIMESFKSILNICEEERIPLLLIAGDLFHRQPLVRELKEVNYLFGQLTDTRVVLIAGNHDYIGERSNYKEFTFSKNVTMLDSQEMERVYFEDLNIEVYGFSYHTRDIREPRYDQVFVERKDRINILLAHGGDERNIPINKNKLKELEFDYIALGHIHKPEIIAENIAYCGSLEPLDVNEVGPRGYIRGNIEKGECSIEFVPHSKRRYYHLTINSTESMTNEELLDVAKEKLAELGMENIYKIVIQGIRSPEMFYEKEFFYHLGNVIDVQDETVPDYDFDQLYEENEDNIIGRYIDTICNSNESDAVIRKALYYGIEALLKAKE